MREGYPRSMPYKQRRLVEESNARILEMLLKRVDEYADNRGMSRRRAIKRMGHKGFSRPSAARLKVKR